MGIGGLGIGDWGLGIGDWAQSPIPIEYYIINSKIYIYKYMYLFKKQFKHLNN